MGTGSWELNGIDPPTFALYRVPDVTGLEASRGPAIPLKILFNL